VRRREQAPLRREGDAEAGSAGAGKIAPVSALSRVLLAAAALSAAAAAGCSGTAPPQLRASAGGSRAAGPTVAEPALGAPGGAAPARSTDPARRPAAGPEARSAPPASGGAIPDAAAPAAPSPATAPEASTTPSRPFSRRPAGPPSPLPRDALFATPAAAGEGGSSGDTVPAGLPAAGLAASRRITYLARDGMEVPALLTLPPGVEPRGLPLVVLVRRKAGGRPYAGFDPRVELLASRGYAVLRPDGRGAGVPGADPAAAGDPWSPAALDDVADGVVELVRRGIVDGDRVAIAGSGYGGWAALAAAALTPDLYAAAVALDAPPGPGWPAAGEAATGPDPSLRPARRAPLARVADVRAPVLVAVGDDTAAPLPAATDALVAALRPGCRELEYLRTPPGAGSAAEGGERLAVWAAVELFLSRHLGGRYEEIPAELAGQVAALRVDTAALPPAAWPAPPVGTAGAGP